MAQRVGVATRPAAEPVDVRRRTTKRVGVVAALFLCAWAFDAAFAVRHGFFDLRVYYGAINYWAGGGGEIYDYLLPNQRYGFTYPPFAALTMLPMAYVGWHVAIAISLVLTVGASLTVVYWFVAPMARRHGWTPWFAVAIAACLLAVFEPLRETLLFGQVNALLLLLVVADLLLLVRGNRSLAGVGIGIATAIKLTPGIFIVYLLITRRYRAAIVAGGATLAATLLAGAVAPDASREFWTDALWDTSRVGSQAFVSNQSLSGVIYRWDPQHPSTLALLALMLLVLVVWAVRARAAVRHGDEKTGLALTGLVAGLVSPISWVHHLVWAIPALLLLVDHGLAASPASRRRRWLLGLAGVTYAIMCSRLVWQFNGSFETFGGWVGSNAYVWLTLILLASLPFASTVASTPIPRSGQPADSSDQVNVDRRASLDIDANRSRQSTGDGADTVTVGDRRLVGAEHR